MSSLQTPQNLGNSQSDFIQINVGGQLFPCSRITLTSFSGYFASMFSNDWYGDDGNNRESTTTTYFIDQDPDAFQILLSYMRNGFIKSATISETVLVQAEFLGIDSLIHAVKCSAYRYLHNHHSQTLGEEECCHCFDEKYGGILSAIRQGILPQSIQPSVRGHKEYAHLGISSDTVVMPFPIPDSGKKYLPCLMTKLILPTLDPPEPTTPPPTMTPPEESSSSTTNAPKYSFPTLIESLNWLHRNGFVEEDKHNNDVLLHCCDDIYSDQPLDPRMIQLFGHTWFSRRVVKADDRSECKMTRAPHWESPILYNKTSSSSSFLDRREFAALVSLYPEYQGDPLTLEVAVASNRSHGVNIDCPLRIIDDAAEVGFAGSRTVYIDSNPVQWLATQGYTKIENEYSKLLQQLYRDAGSKALLWDNETISRIHVRVFSRDLIE